ncbi:Lrp/AsnC family transcriptional regulator [Acidianus hospitalis]|jgi:DNA-binding Lrp family transcriptional regulator|uniref:Lrp/AsnC family transcriptional regulator n=3 Tax=Acidianus TaxID=12914 RepID=A0A650CXL0_ACIAM|nr:Lrp/AsnC family transcriptional regulator [Acidianus ambivalens]MUM64497.1 Lrp/AsnC family transcriptional regulator [Acidianus infernus]PVU74117.1 Lrp/AsnC family transcriptional regulator [Acidianus hospitalis]QGR22570.1 Lrp/AsnC family transcriptional regulator [Acidianus ambivalens]
MTKIFKITRKVLIVLYIKTNGSLKLISNPQSKNVSAIILINTDAGGEEEVYEKLKELKEVSEAYIVYGVYDIVAKIEAQDMDSLRNFVSSTIRKLPKVRSTLTMIIMESSTMKK